LPLALLADALPLTVRALLAALRQLPPNSASHRKALEAVLTAVLDRCLGPAPVTVRQACHCMMLTRGENRFHTVVFERQICRITISNNVRRRRYNCYQGVSCFAD